MWSSTKINTLCDDDLGGFHMHCFEFVSPRVLNFYLCVCQLSWFQLVWKMTKIWLSISGSVKFKSWTCCRYHTSISVITGTATNNRIRPIIGGWFPEHDNMSNHLESALDHAIPCFFYWMVMVDMRCMKKRNLQTWSFGFPRALMFMWNVLLIV